MLTLILNALARRAETARRRALLRDLLSRSDHHLRDIGLERAEIEAALALPRDSDPWATARAASARVLAMDGRF